MTPATQKLLELIRKYEGGPGPKGYGQVYGGAPKEFLSKDVSKMKLIDILEMQRKMIKAKSRSTAVGGYQYIYKTLFATLAGMRLLGSLNQVWTPELQDKFALFQLRLRGLDRFLKGVITREAFANSLAAEWASLPMVTGPKKGQSRYAGDGLNASHHTVASVLAVLDELKAEYQKQNGKA